MLYSLVKDFSMDEAGAVTVDWVVLTAGIVGLGLAVAAVVRPAVSNLGNKIATAVNAVNAQ